MVRVHEIYGAEAALAGWDAGGSVELPVAVIGVLPMDGSKLSSKVA